LIYLEFNFLKEIDMGWVSGLLKVATGAAAGVVAITALPIFGAVGAITATGIAVGAVVGGAAGAKDEFDKEAEKDKKS
jgi:hypothetical protein